MTTQAKTSKTKQTKTAPTAEDLAQQAKIKSAEDRRVAQLMTDGTFNMAVVRGYLPVPNSDGQVGALLT